MLLATVDIGTNSTKILLAQVDKMTFQMDSLREEVRLTRLGEGSQSDQFLKPAAIDRTMESLREFKTIVDSSAEKVEAVYVGATMCTREAKNQKEFLDRVLKEVGWQVHVLSGDQEAYFSFLGARTYLPDLKHPIVAIDIGGGSTEWILQRQISAKLESVSLALGTVRETEAYLKIQPPSKADVEKVQNHVDSILSGISESLAPHDCQFIGIGGTVSSLHKMMDRKQESFKLKNLEKVIEKLCELDINERIKRYPHLGKGRADVILAGALILMGAMDRFDIDECFVSRRGLRFGLALGVARNELPSKSPLNQ